MQPLQQQFCHIDLYFCIGSISKRGNSQNHIQEDQNSQMGGLWVVEGGKEDPKLVPEGWVGVWLLEGKWGMSWLVSILPRANQVFFCFLNKETAIPFLVPTFPERKAIPVMWVVSIYPHRCYWLCSAGLQVPAQGGMCGWGWVGRDPGDTILQVRWDGVDKGHFRELSRGFNCKQRWAV